MRQAAGRHRVDTTRRLPVTADKPISMTTDGEQGGPNDEDGRSEGGLRDEDGWSSMTGTGGSDRRLGSRERTVVGCHFCTPLICSSL